MDYYLVEDLNPEPWTASEGSVGRKGGKTFVLFHKPTQLRNYQEALTEMFKQQNPQARLYTGNLELHFYFWRELASYETPTGRQGRAHIADATNLQKSTEDALQGILYKNDRDIRCIQSVIVSQTPSTIPAILIGIGQHDSTSLGQAFAKRLELTVATPQNAQLQKIELDPTEVF